MPSASPTPKHRLSFVRCQLSVARRHAPNNGLRTTDRGQRTAFTLVELPVVSTRRREAFTLVELLVVIAIIGIMVALLLPAIQASRESARRATCTNQLGQLILALHDFEAAHGHFPAGTVNETGPIRNLPAGNHMGWMAHILPYIEEVPLYQNIDLSQSAYHFKNDRARQAMIGLLICPSSPAVEGPYSNYAACHNDKEAPIDVSNAGAFILNTKITRDDLKDGAAHTLFLGEKGVEDFDLGWLSGTPGTLRNVGVPLNNLPRSGGWSASLPWLYDHPPDDAGWEWSDQQIDPVSGKVVRLDPATGEYKPIDEFKGAPAAPPPADDKAAENAVADADAAAQGAPPNSDVASANPRLKTDKSGRLPHATLGGNPAAPLAVGGFSSRHVTGVNFALGDGSVRFILDQVSPGLLGRLANRADGKIIDAREW
jgi:prepilin-type N-terminal cleavage/methylation domain-containing protein